MVEYFNEGSNKQKMCEQLQLINVFITVSHVGY